MSALVGVLRQMSLVDPVWVLEADDGRSYQLIGDVPAALQNRRVRVHGEPSAGFGFSMVGELFEVRSVSPA